MLSRTFFPLGRPPPLCFHFSLSARNAVVERQIDSTLPKRELPHELKMIEKLVYDFLGTIFSSRLNEKIYTNGSSELASARRADNFIIVRTERAGGAVKRTSLTERR